MSLSTMTNDLARPGQRQLPEAIALNNAPAGATADKTAAQRAFDALAKFIPTELLAPFIMVMELIENETVAWDPRAVYWLFVLLAPIFLALFEYAKTAQADLEWPDGRQVTWRAFLAAVAFAVWSLAIPANSYQEAIGGIAVAGLLAVFISPILAAVDSIVIKLLRQNADGAGK